MLKKTIFTLLLLAMLVAAASVPVAAAESGSVTGAVVNGESLTKALQAYKREMSPLQGWQGKPVEETSVLSLTDLPPAVQFATSEAMGRNQAAYHLEPEQAGFAAATPRQGLQTHFDGQGLLVKTATAHFGLSLISLGYGAQQGAVPTANPVASENRLNLQRGYLHEWYRNGPLGLQQGFTLSRPPGPATGEPLTLRFDLNSNLTPQVSADGRSLTLYDEQGHPQLRYANLLAYDATGRAIPAWLSLHKETMQIQVLDQAARYPLTIDPFIQQAYLKASNAGQLDNFGISVAISGDAIVVGASGEDSNGSGESDNSASQAGAAYVYVRSGSSWSQQAYLKASNADGGDLFGTSVAISGDTIVVGAPYEASNGSGESDNSAPLAGAAYVYVRSGTTWSQQAYLKASNAGAFDRFGTSVAISGEIVVVGATSEASNGSGESDNSAVAAGAAYVYVRSGTTWSQQAYLKASNVESNDVFGTSVAISGETVVVGAIGEASNGSGQSDNSAVAAGAAYVYVRSGSSWSQHAYLKASNAESDDGFGLPVAISGETVVVGAEREDSNGSGQSDNSATDAGAAYVYMRSGSSWSQQAYLKASNADGGDGFGLSVAISGETVVVGAEREDSNGSGESDNSASQAGAAYIYERSGSSWSQQAYLKASNVEPPDNFGTSVAVSGETMVIGAIGEDSNGSGESDNSAPSAGAAYVFEAATVDIALSKTESIDPVIAGSGPGNLTYVITAQNNGPAAASGLAISELLTLPAGVTIDSITPSSGTYLPANDPNGTWTIGNLANGASETLAVTLIVSANAAAGTDVIANTAAVTTLNETDTDNSNDSATETTSIHTLVATCGGFNVIDDGSGQLSAPGFSGNLIVGTNGYDWLTGTDGADLMLGFDGPDDLYGQGGADDLDGGNGNDFCKGGPGSDTIVDCEGASSAAVTDATTSDIIVDAARRANDNDGEFAIVQHIKEFFLPLITR